VTARVYAVSFTHQPFAGDLCWGAKCGKGIVGAIVDDGLELMPCVEVECPFLEKESPEPIGTDDQGRDVYLRKLRQP
jgi:hypothetical protein